MESALFNSLRWIDLIQFVVYLAAFIFFWAKISVRIELLSKQMEQVSGSVNTPPGAINRIMTLQDCLRVHSDCWMAIGRERESVQERLKEIRELVIKEDRP